FMPAGQSLGHVGSRRDRFPTVYPANIADFHTGEAVPPIRQTALIDKEGVRQLLVASSRAFADQSRGEVEDLFDDVDQLIDAVSAPNPGRGERGMLSRRAVNNGKSPWKPRMFQGSAKAPQAMPRCKRSSVSGKTRTA